MHIIKRKIIIYFAFLLFYVKINGMNDGKSIHGGHRDRIIKKFIKHPESFCEHELVELLLFFAVPRIDTNPLAHRLVDAFGSVSKIFSASSAELMTVDGVGEKVAAFISLISKFISVVDKQSVVDKTMMSPDFIKKEVIKSFSNMTEEKIIMFFLDDKFKLKTKMVVSGGDEKSVSIDVTRLGEALVAVKPKYALIAHNHPSGIALPSRQDDNTTERVGVVCAVHGVALIDHIIVSGEETFSYFSNGRLDKIKKESIIEKMLKQ